MKTLIYIIIVLTFLFSPESVVSQKYVTIDRKLQDVKNSSSAISEDNLNWVTAPIMDKFEAYSDGLALAWNENGETCFIDTAGKVVISDHAIKSSDYFGFHSFSEGFAPVLMFCNINSHSWELKHAYVNTSLETTIEPQFENAGMFSEGLAWVQPNANGKVGFINKTGEMVIQPQFNMSDSHYSFNNGVAWVLLDGLWGLINTKGETVIVPQFDKVYPFANGFAPVEKDRRWGFVNSKGEMITEFKYDGVHYFSEGIALFLLNEK